MGISKGSAICPLDDNAIFIIRKHGPDKNFTPKSKASSTLSRQTSVQSYQSKTSRLTLDEDLEALRAANIIFIRHLQRNQPAISQAQNKYTIVNSCGETLFFAVEATDIDQPKEESDEEENKQLKFVVVNTQGEEVFDIDGHPGVKGFGAHATIRRDSTILGNVAQTNKMSSCSLKRLPLSYLIETPDGKVLQKIVTQRSWKNSSFLGANDFNVCSPDGTIVKAKVSLKTNSITLEEYSQTDTYALSFHTTDMDGKLKALLIAAVLILDFQLAERTVEWRDYKSIMMRILLCAILFLIFIGVVTLVVKNAIEFEKERPKRFPGALPPP